MKKYECIFFDLTDTLLRRVPSLPDLLHHNFLEKSIHVDREMLMLAGEFSEYWIGEQSLNEMTSLTRMDDEEFNKHIVDIYIEHIGGAHERKTVRRILENAIHYRDRTEYIIEDGARETLENLRASGVLLGIVSNNPREIRIELERLDIERYFNVISISSEVGVEKPNPEIMLMTAAKLSVIPSDCIYVGDHPFDVVCAKKANMASAWYVRDKHIALPIYRNINPDLFLKSLDEILRQ